MGARPRPIAQRRRCLRAALNNPATKEIIVEPPKPPHGGREPVPAILQNRRRPSANSSQLHTCEICGLGFGWMALVAAELVGANSGLGFLINDARSVLRTDIIVVGMLTIGIMGLIIDALLRLAMRRLMPWANPENG